MTLVSLLNRLLLVVLMLTVIVGTVLGGRWMLADLALDNTRYTLSQWDTNGSMPTEQAWERVRAELERAQHLDPGNAEIRRLQGLLWEWRLFIADTPLTASQRAIARQRAIEHYRESARLRPAWPDGWAHLARQKAFIGTVDEEFTLALSRAATLGSWEPRIQLLVAETGTAVWEQLDEASRKLVVETIARGFSKPRSANRLVTQFQPNLDFLQNTICPQLTADSLTGRSRQACP